MLLRLAVVPRDHGLGDDGDLRDRLVQKIQRGLLVAKEAAVEHRALVAGVGARHGETACQRGLLSGVLTAVGWLNTAIQSAASLEQEAAVPVRGQCDGEADCIGLAVAAGALIDHAVDAAVGGRRRRNAGRARRHFLRLPDDDVMPGHRELC